MLFTNYSAYITIAKSYLNPELIAESEKNINKGLEISQITVAKKVKKIQNEENTTKTPREESYNSKDLRHII